jgi:SAM-dependent methyltransferase
MNEKNINPSSYYDSAAADYHKMYDGDLLDPGQPYPANYFRLKLLQESFKDRHCVLDVGCGDGYPLSTLPAEIKYAFDVSPNMVEEARKRLPTVFVADLMKPETYAFLDIDFDGIVCSGVMPHIEDTKQALINIKSLLSSDGKVFVEFRNELFNLFTFNRLSVDFMVDRLVEHKYSSAARDALSGRLKMDAPAMRPYDGLLAKYHNPIEITELFADLGFRDIGLLWYHHHPTPPWLPFDRKDAMAMEGGTSWKSMFQCSAFVVEAYA